MNVHEEICIFLNLSIFFEFSQKHKSLSGSTYGRHLQLEKSVKTWKLPTNATGRTQLTQTPWNLKKAQNKLANIYLKEQTEYIQNQIYKIRDSVKDRQFRIACQRINEVSRRKNTGKAKLKATNQQERIHLWKQHFENFHGNPRTLHMNQSRELLVSN